MDAADHGFMLRALQLAERGIYSTTPNPRVGCVLVKNGRIIGEGWHERAGGPHAEVMALSSSVGAGALHGGMSASPSANTSSSATAYVTLEPCSHFGRTPPCAEALIAAGVSRVVAAMQDPNPEVAGQGLEKLRAAGITVDCGLLEAQATELNIGFVARMQRGRPWLRVKLATSLDGKTALANGVSQWITGAAARLDAHHWRARSCALLTGSGTVTHDNPRLTVRDVATSRQPLRVVLDSQLQTSPDAQILVGGGALILFAQADAGRKSALEAKGVELIEMPGSSGKIDLAEMLQELGRRGVNEVLVEAGACLNGALLNANLVDELLIYQAPMLLGDGARGMFSTSDIARLAEARRLEIVERRSLDADLFIRARFAPA